MLALGEETAVQAVVGSIVWAFRFGECPADVPNGGFVHNETVNLG